MRDYGPLLKLLRKESYPLAFKIKCIGKNTERFHHSISEFEHHYGELVREGSRLSSANKNIALTYSFQAHSAEVIIEIFEALSSVRDVVLVL